MGWAVKHKGKSRWRWEKKGTVGNMSQDGEIYLTCLCTEVEKKWRRGFVSVKTQRIKRTNKVRLPALTNVRLKQTTLSWKRDKGEEGGKSLEGKQSRFGFWVKRIGCSEAERGSNLTHYMSKQKRRRPEKQRAERWTGFVRQRDKQSEREKHKGGEKDMVRKGKNRFVTLHFFPVICRSEHQQCSSHLIQNVTVSLSGAR